MYSPFALASRASVPQSSVQSYVSILLSVYGAALLIGSPFAGWYADKSSSRRVPLLIGLLALAGATILLCESFPHFIHISTCCNMLLLLKHTRTNY